MRSERHRLFERLVIGRLDRARRLKGLKFIGLRDIIRRRGAVEAAKSFMSEGNTGKLNRGLRAFARAGLSRLSVEQAVVDCEEFKIFSKRDVASAKKRLRAVKDLFDKK